MIRQQTICFKSTHWACSTLLTEYARLCHRWQAMTVAIRSVDTQQFSTRSVTFCLIRATLIITASFRGNHVLQWSIWRSLCINKLVIRIRHLIIWQHAAYDLIFWNRGTEATLQPEELQNSYVHHCEFLWAHFITRYYKTEIEGRHNQCLNEWSILYSIYLIN